MFINNDSHKSYILLNIIFLLTLYFTVRPRLVNLLLILFVAFVQNLNGTNLIYHTHKIDSQMTLYFLYIFAISAINYENSDNWWWFIPYQFALTSILFHTYPQEDDADGTPVIINVYKIFIVICSILGIIEAISGISITSYLGIGMHQASYIQGRVSVVFYNPLIFSTFILVGVFAEICYPYKSQVKHIITLLLLIASLILTETRSTWLAISIGTLFYIFCLQNKKNVLTSKTFVRIVVSIFIIAIIVFLLRNQIQKLFFIVSRRISQTTTSDNSFIQRLGAVSNCIEYLGRHPISLIFGNGHQFSKVFMSKNLILGSFTSIDNQYFTSIMNYGLIGLLLFWCPFFLRIPAAMHTKSNADSRFYMSVLISLLIQFIFYDALAWYSIYLLITLLMVFACRVDNNKSALNMYMLN